MFTAVTFEYLITATDYMYLHCQPDAKPYHIGILKVLSNILSCWECILDSASKCYIYLLVRTLQVGKFGFWYSWTNIRPPYHVCEYNGIHSHVQSFPQVSQKFFQIDPDNCLWWNSCVCMRLLYIWRKDWSGVKTCIFAMFWLCTWASLDVWSVLRCVHIIISSPMQLSSLQDWIQR